MIKLFMFIVIMLFSLVVIAQIGDLRFKSDIDNTDTLMTKEIFSRLPQSEITTTTPWTPVGKALSFRGVRMIDLLNYININGSALKVHALDGYEIMISMEDAVKYNILLADEMDGKKLGIRDFGPYFVVYPVDEYPEELNIPKYLSQFVRQVDKITVKK